MKIKISEVKEGQRFTMIDTYSIPAKYGCKYRTEYNPISEKWNAIPIDERLYTIGSLHPDTEVELIEETPESVVNDIVLGKLLQNDEKAAVEQLPVNVRVWGEDELDIHKEITQSGLKERNVVQNKKIKYILDDIDKQLSKKCIGVEAGMELYSGLISNLIVLGTEQQYIIEGQEKLIKELIRDNQNHGRRIDYIEKVLKIDQI